MITKENQKGIEILPQTKREREFLGLLKVLLESFFPLEEDGDEPD
jgi:hypothetical protein